MLRYILKQFYDFLRWILFFLIYCVISVVFMFFYNEYHGHNEPRSPRSTSPFGSEPFVYQERLETSVPEASASSVQEDFTQEPNSNALSEEFARPVDIIRGYAPHTYGVKTREGYSWIIKEGDPLPTTTTENFTTSYDYQDSTTIEIFQKKRYPPYSIKKIGHFEFNNFPRLRRGQLEILITFKVNDKGELHATAYETYTHRTEHLTLVSTSINTDQPDSLESDDWTCREVTNALLGIWFWELNRDIITRTQAIKRFLLNENVTRLVKCLNDRIEHRMSLKSYTDKSTCWIDYAKRNEDFASLMNSVVSKIRPTGLIPTNLPQGLTDDYYRAFFEQRVPSIIRQLEEQEMRELRAEEIVEIEREEETFIDVVTSEKVRPDSIVEQPLAFGDQIVFEPISPEYFYLTSGYEPDEDFHIQTLILKKYNYIGLINVDIYNQQRLSKTEYQNDLAQLMNYMRRPLHMEQCRGSGQQSLTRYQNVLDFFEEIITNFNKSKNPKDLHLKRVIETFKEDFGYH